MEHAHWYNELWLNFNFQIGKWKKCGAQTFFFLFKNVNNNNNTKKHILTWEAVQKGDWSTRPA